MSGYANDTTVLSLCRIIASGIYAVNAAQNSSKFRDLHGLERDRKRAVLSSLYIPTPGFANDSFLQKQPLTDTAQDCG